jgi:hypothetical protein
LKLIEKLISGAKNYPFRRRLPPAAALACASAWEIYRSKGLTPLELFVFVLGCSLPLFGSRTQLFSFVLGVGIGVAMALILGSQHF